MTDLRRFFRRDRFAALAGVRLTEVRPGFARARMRVGPSHLNGVDVAQGGAGPGWLQAEAREVSLSPHRSSATVHVRDRAGALVAVFQGLAYRKKETLDEVERARPRRPGRTRSGVRRRITPGPARGTRPARR